MSNSSSPQSVREDQLQGQTTSNGGVTSGSLLISGNPRSVSESTTEAEGIAASGGSTVNVTTDDPQVLEAALSSNTQIATGAEATAMDAATASNNSLTSLESDFETEQSELTDEAASVNLAQSNAPGAAYSAYEQTAQTADQGGSTNLTTLYYILGASAAAFAIWNYIKGRK